MVIRRRGQGFCNDITKALVQKAVTIGGSGSKNVQKSVSNHGKGANIFKNSLNLVIFEGIPFFHC